MTSANKVGWAIDPDRCALLIHDMQPHYLAVLPSEQQDRLIANVRDIAVTCVGRDVPIFASQVPPARDVRERGLMLDMWGRGPTEGSRGLAPELGLTDADVRPLLKRSYSAFYGTDFEVLLRRLGRDAILIVGVYTSIGCHLSAADAFMRDIRAFMIADAMADFNSGDHDTALATAARTCARIVDSAEAIRSLSVKAR